MTINPFIFDPCPARGKVEQVTKRPFAIEAKLDGTRGLLAHTAEHGLTLTGRRTSDVTGQKLDKLSHVPHLISALEFLANRYPYDLILDGEICFHDKSSNEVTSIMGSHAEKAIAKQEQVGKLSYLIFDVLLCGGIDWRGISYADRRRRLEEMHCHLSNAGLAEHIHLVPQFTGSVEHAFDQAVAQGYEGLIIKTLHGKYHHLEWAKMKSTATYDFIIMGYELSDSETFAGNGIAALKLGLYDDNGVLQFCTDCSGMTHEMRRMFYDSPGEHRGKVVEIKAQQMFKDTGAVRHPRFVRFRPDVDAGVQTFKKYGVKK